MFDVSVTGVRLYVECPQFSVVRNFRGLTIGSEAGGNTWEVLVVNML